MGFFNISQDLEYLAIFTFILTIPKILLRFRIPSGVTALIIGISFGQFDPNLIDNDLFIFLSRVGITSLFLFAGLEIETDELKEKKSYLFKYLGKFNVILLLIAALLFWVFSIDFKYALLLSLGLFTPSAGFIISSLHAYDLNEKDESWIKSKAFSKEIVSILILFITLQYDQPAMFFVTILVFVAFYFLLPKLISGFIKFISPYAPNTELSFLVALALLLGVITKEMGTYYIVGSFMVGLIGNRFKKDIFHEGEDVLFRSLESFFAVFLPFYFFHVGLGIDTGQLTDKTFIYGLAAFFIFVPFRIFLIQYGILNFEGNKVKDYYKVSLTLMPTLVFGLIIAKIIIEQKPEYQEYAYGLVIYTLITSILPALFSAFGKKKTVIF